MRPSYHFCGIGLLLTLCHGCSGPRTTEPRLNVDEVPDFAFHSYLAEADLITVDEAYRAMLILADGEDTSNNFEERRNKLESRGIAKSAWDLQQDHVVDAGSVAYMICKICEIKGGVSMRLFGSWGLGDRRYALRELMYLKMIEESVDYEYVTGATMFALMRAADELMENKGLYESGGVELSDETDRDEQGNLIVPDSVGNEPVEDAGS